MIANINGTYGRCSNRKISDFKFGDTVFQTLTFNQRLIKRIGAVVEIKTNSKLVVIKWISLRPNEEAISYLNPNKIDLYNNINSLRYV